MSDKIDIRQCLKGTAYEVQAERIARAAEKRGFDSLESIDNLPALQLMPDPYTLVATIKDRHQALQQEKKVDPVERARKVKPTAVEESE